MAEGVISKANLGRLISAIRAGARFYAPVKGETGVSLEEVAEAGQVYFGPANVRLPIKRFFLPQSERLYSYKDGKVADVPTGAEKAVLFGVRACDAAALEMMDRVFVDEKFADPYYRSRRENTTLIVTTCKTPPPTCFCTSVEGGPAGRRGADVAVAELGDALLFESVSSKGEEFMKAHAAVFGAPTAEQRKARDEAAAAAEKAMARLDLQGLAEKLKAGFESPGWAEIAARCLGCGACTYFCPTCHCFGIHDETTDGRGCCLRVQDSCMFPGFTLEASGHNPRGRKGERMRQRIMHKFRYTVENFGEVFCVGCGRCIINCPVNVDVRETISAPPKGKTGP